MGVGLESSGKLNFWYGVKGKWSRPAKTANAVLAAGASDWHHVVCVADSTINGIGGKKIYFDGVLQDLDATFNGNTTGCDFSLYNSDSHIHIGSMNYHFPIFDAFKGALDDVRIFNKALSQEEITFLATGTESLTEETKTPITVNAIEVVNDPVGSNSWVVRILLRVSL
jgi:hypothetical protein